MRFTHYFWDYDGTLFDTYDAVTSAFLKGVKDNGIDITFEKLRWMTKHSLGWTANQLSEQSGVPAQVILDGYYRHAPEEETLEAMKPYPGIRETLEAICRNGGKNYLYSHRDQKSIEALRHYGLDHLFTDAITKDDHFPRKPAPDALNYLAEKHSLDPADCVMIGDRSLDVEAGINAGMSGVLFDPEDFCQGNAPTDLKYTSIIALRQAIVE